MTGGAPSPSTVKLPLFSPFYSRVPCNRARFISVTLGSSNDNAGANRASVRTAGGSVGRLAPPAQVLREEPLRRPVEVQPVLRLGEPVALVRIEQVLVRDALLAQRG